MAEAIVLGCNRKENCIHYVKNELIEEQETIKEMTLQEKEKQQKKLNKYLIIRINPKITTVRINTNDLMKMKR